MLYTMTIIHYLLCFPNIQLFDRIVLESFFRKIAIEVTSDVTMQKALNKTKLPKYTILNMQQGLNTKMTTVSEALRDETFNNVVWKKFGISHAPKMPALSGDNLYGDVVSAEK